MNDLLQLAIFGFASGAGGALATILVTRFFIYFEKRALEAKKQIEKKVSSRKNGDIKK